MMNIYYQLRIDHYLNLAFSFYFFSLSLSVSPSFFREMGEITLESRFSRRYDKKIVLRKQKVRNNDNVHNFYRIVRMESVKKKLLPKNLVISNQFGTSAVVSKQRARRYYYQCYILQTEQYQWWQSREKKCWQKKWTTSWTYWIQIDENPCFYKSFRPY